MESRADVSPRERPLRGVDVDVAKEIVDGKAKRGGGSHHIALVLALRPRLQQLPRRLMIFWFLSL